MTWVVGIWAKTKFYALAAGAALVAAIGAYWRIREDGKSAVRSEQDQERLKSMKERKAVDDEVDQMGSADVDANFSRWLRDK